jgi:hypothetical protein
MKTITTVVDQNVFLALDREATDHVRQLLILAAKQNPEFSMGQCRRLVIDVLRCQRDCLEEWGSWPVA